MEQELRLFYWLPWSLDVSDAAAADVLVVVLALLSVVVLLLPPSLFLAVSFCHALLMAFSPFLKSFEMSLCLP